MPRVRPGGLLLADNTLWSRPRRRRRPTQAPTPSAMQAFNDHVAADARVESFILPVATASPSA